MVGSAGSRDEENEISLWNIRAKNFSENHL